MNKNNKKRQYRDLENKRYSGCGINPKDILPYDYLNGNISDLLLTICCASLNKQDVSKLANLNPSPPPKCRFRLHGVIIQGGWCGDAWSMQPCCNITRSNVCSASIPASKRCCCFLARQNTNNRGTWISPI